MKQSRLTEEQIIGMLKEQEAGMSTADVFRKHGLSSATFYKFKARYGGLDVSDARRLKQLEDANSKLGKLVADLLLDKDIQQDVIRRELRDLSASASSSTSSVRTGTC